MVESQSYVVREQKHKPITYLVDSESLRSDLYELACYSQLITLGRIRLRGPVRQCIRGCVHVTHMLVVIYLSYSWLIDLNGIQEREPTGRLGAGTTKLSTSPVSLMV